MYKLIRALGGLISVSVSMLAQKSCRVDAAALVEKIREEPLAYVE
jgi:hypothetical protein